FDKNDITTTEPGANTDGSISVTTGCVLSATDLTVTWYKIENSLETDYTSDRPSPVYSTARSTCTRNCHTEEDKKVTSGFTHTEYTGSDYVEVEYKVTISHSSYSGSMDQFTWTSAKYRLKASSTFTTPSTSASSTTSTVPTSTSTTPTSTTSTSVSKSTTTTHTTTSAISTMSSTSSTTKAKSETTTRSADSSSSETVVIIVASVVGGLFFVGIVIAIIMMLLSQQKRRKHVSKGIHTHVENKNTWQYQRSKSPSSLGHLNHGYTFNGKSSGHRFRQNPHFVRQPNRPVTDQYQPWNGNCRQNRYIYPGLSGGKQYRSGYVVQDRRVNKAPNDYNAGNLRQQYYSHPHNPQRSYARNPNRETLQTEDQNYVAADYSIYW
ncbi:uncharacterized protein LOC128552726, partial [Mercenaria mercenaria]|uniref:uncharacterized protein LOC128552726 n=1 Tax=Mercenaria mercenaria TaxID=6596 RepID=UPI00234F06B0